MNGVIRALQWIRLMWCSCWGCYLSFCSEGSLLRLLIICVISDGLVWCIYRCWKVWKALCCQEAPVCDWIVKWMVSKPLWVRLHILFTHTHSPDAHAHTVSYTHKSQQPCTSCAGGCIQKSNKQANRGVCFNSSKCQAEIRAAPPTHTHTHSRLFLLSGCLGSVLTEGHVHWLAL